MDNLFIYFLMINSCTSVVFFFSFLFWGGWGGGGCQQINVLIVNVLQIVACGCG